MFAPAGGWIADRFGAKRVFLTAMGVFLLGSIACGFSHSLPMLVASRILQGTGGAMMVPVGRLIIVGSTPKARLVNAMTWFTTPALVGPLIGPPLAGFVLGVADWPWIFFLNIPVGILGMLAVARFAPDIKRPYPGRFDTVGFLLAAVSISTLVVIAETAGQKLLPLPVVIALGVALLVAGGLFLRHVRRTAKPILDLGLLKYQTFRASLTGGTLVRLGVGATPFLTPLLLQVGLGWTPVKAGFVTIATGFGAMSMRTIVRRVIARFGFRTVLLVSGVGAAVLSSIPGFFRETTPVWLMFLVMFLAGMIRSTQFISANTIAYADVPPEQVTRASTLAAVVQQIGLSLGVSLRRPDADHHAGRRRGVDPRPLHPALHHDRRLDPAGPADLRRPEQGCRVRDQREARLAPSRLDPRPRDLAGDLVGGAVLVDRALEHLVQGLHQARQLALDPGRIEGRPGLQRADFAGHIDDAAAVDDVVGQRRACRAANSAAPDFRGRRAGCWRRRRSPCPSAAAGCRR